MIGARGKSPMIRVGTAGGQRKEVNNPLEGYSPKKVNGNNLINLSPKLGNKGRKIVIKKNHEFDKAAVTHMKEQEKENDFPKFQSFDETA
jgi:hypothetical protein